MTIEINDPQDNQNDQIFDKESVLKFEEFLLQQLNLDLAQKVLKNDLTPFDSEDFKKILYVNKNNSKEDLIEFKEEIKKLLNHDSLTNVSIQKSEFNLIRRQPKMIAPCNYITYISSTNSSNVELVSKEYHYANIVPNLPVCSHPKINQTSKVKCCMFMADQEECIFYSPTLSVLKETDIQIDNSEYVFKYQLIYSKAIDFVENIQCHRFLIKNITDQTVVNELKYPVEYIDLENAKLEAIRIYDEYVSSYVNTNSKVDTDETEKRIEPPAINKIVEKESYLQYVVSQGK